MPIIVPDPGRFYDEPAHLAWHAALREAHPELSLPEVTSRDQNHLDAHAILAATVNQWGEFPHLIPASPTNSTLLHDVAHRGAHTWSNAQEEEPAEITHGSQVPTSPLVGLPDGWEPEQTVSSIDSVSNNQVIENLRITGGVNLFGSGGRDDLRTGVVIRNCEIGGTVDAGYVGVAADKVIENCVINGNGADGAVKSRGYTLRRSVVFNASRFCVADDFCLIEENHFYDCFNGIGPDAHRSGIGVGYDGGHRDVIIRRNWIDTRPQGGKDDGGMSAALVVYDAPGEPIQNWTVQDNVIKCIDTHGYAFYCGKNFQVANNIVITGNRWDRDGGKECGEAGMLGTILGGPQTWPGSVWTGNTWGPPTESGWPPEGSLVPAPFPAETTD